jgi:heparin/heparan-sulfate lyase
MSIRIPILTFLCVVLFAPTAALARGLPVGGKIAAVSKSRPRMLLTSKSLAALKRRCATDPVSKKLLAAMKARCDGMMRMTPALDNQGRHYMPSFALLYALTGEKRYAKMAARWLALMAQRTIENEWTCLEYVPTGAFAFDWIHDTLSTDERRAAARGLLRQLERVKKLWRHSDYNNHFVLEHMSQLHVALALAHERGFEKTAADLFAEAEVWLKRHVIQAANEMAGGADGDEAGGHAEGYGYDHWGYARPLARLLAAWKSATGEDPFPNCVPLKHHALWAAHGRLPDGRMVRSEDCQSGLRWGQDSRSTFELVAREYRDGIARTLADPIETKYPQVIWPILVFRDPTVRPAPLKALPRARHFRGLGHVMSRSAWDDPDAVMTTFQCGPFFAGHQHADNNAFTVFFRGRLAIDSGVNEYSSHRANYYSRSVAHNTITVLDPDEQFPSAVWSDRGSGGSNDGGQRRVGFPGRATASANEKANRDIGRILRFEATDDFCYAAGDATRSYDRAKVKRFIRHFVHVYPDLVIVLDDVECGSASFETRWLLHSIGKPVIDGDRVSIVNGKGALTVWSLRPEAKSREIRVVGGPGREYLVGGKNYPPDAKSDPDAGAWRVEVVDTARRTSRTFLHVLLAGDAKTREADAKRWSFEVRGSGRSVRLEAERRPGGGGAGRRFVWSMGSDGFLRPSR